jgi:hypothetical protein
VQSSNYSLFINQPPSESHCQHHRNSHPTSGSSHVIWSPCHGLSNSKLNHLPIRISSCRSARLQTIRYSWVLLLRTTTFFPDSRAVDKFVPRFRFSRPLPKALPEFDDHPLSRSFYLSSLDSLTWILDPSIFRASI